MAEQYLDENQQEELKQGLYAYLRDKAARRAKTGNSRTFEGMEKQFQDQEKLYNAGALVGGLSEAASMVGSVGGKRAESNIIPTLNKSLYDSRQNLFKNNAALRDMEEKSLQTDMDIARYLTGLDAQKSVLDTAELQREKLRQDLRRRKLEPRLRSKSGLPVMVDEIGTPSELPGYAYNDRALTKTGDSGAWVPFEGQGPGGVVLQRNTKTGQMREVPLPKGWDQKQKPDAESKSVGDLAKNFESDYAKKSQIASVIEKEVEKFDELVRSGNIDAAVRHGEGTLKALNSAFGADAVGVEEADRLGGFLQRFKAPWKPGRMIGYDLDLFSKQLKDKAEVLRGAANDNLNRAKAVRSGGIEELQKFDKKPPQKSVDEMSDREVDEALRSLGIIKQQ